MTRKPDYVFDVWSDDKVELADRQWWAELPAEFLREMNEYEISAHGFRLSYRIRVYMKVKA